MNRLLNNGDRNSLRASSTVSNSSLSKVGNLILLLLLLFTAVLFGCAGGTRGTGGAELTGFKGFVLLDSGEPVAGAAVTLINTGEVTQSADDGSFSVESEVSGEVTFEISQGDTTGTVTISGVPAGSQVTFSVSIHTDDRHVDLDDVEIEDRSSNDNDSSDDNHNSNSSSSSSSGSEAEDDHGGNGHGSDDISDDRGDDNSSDSTDNSDDSSDHGGSGGGSDSSSGGNDDSGNDHGSNGGGGDDNGGNSGSGSGSNGNSGSGHGGRN
jgi:hypothetical protein